MIIAIRNFIIVSLIGNLNNSMITVYNIMKLTRKPISILYIKNTIVRANEIDTAYTLFILTKLIPSLSLSNTKNIDSICNTPRINASYHCIRSPPSDLWHDPRTCLKFFFDTAGIVRKHRKILNCVIAIKPYTFITPRRAE
jgi:hypothetical protein